MTSADHLLNVLDGEEEEVHPDPEPELFEENGLSLQTKTFLLRGLLERAASVVPVKDILPVLKNFQLELSAGRLRVVASDLELSVIATTEMVTTVRPGVAVFPARKLLEIVREADEGDLSIDIQSGTAHIEIGRTSWDLKLAAGRDYPAMPDVSDIEFHPIGRQAFLGALQAVRYAAAKDAGRSNLMMVKVENSRVTACDGSRFQQVRLERDFPLSMQIPIGAVDDLAKLLKVTDLDEIAIGESENQLVFRIATDVFLANKLFAQFPDVEQILLRPALENKFDLYVDRQSLYEAIRRVRINADAETSAIALELGDNILTILAADKYGNRAAESINVSWDSGPRKIVVNHAFLTDMLSGYTGHSCHFKLGVDTKSKRSPLVLWADDESSPAGPPTQIGVVQQMVSDWVGYADSR